MALSAAAGPGPSVRPVFLHQSALSFVVGVRALTLAAHARTGSAPAPPNGGPPVAKKDKIQYVLNFAADLLSLCVSVLLSWLVTDKVLHVLLDYTQEDWGQFILILAFAFLVVFLGGNGASGLTRRSWRAELWLCVKNTLLLAAALAVALLLTKATMLESRYMYVGGLGLHFVGLFVTHTALKTYLNRYFYKANFATMVGIITTVDRAEPLLRDLKQDWAKK